jgi:hypothetical protein
MSRMKQAIDHVKILKQFISPSQLGALGAGCRSEEKGFFFDKIEELARLFSTMPKTYETNGQGDDAIVHLHYFKGNQDWYIIEKDMEDEQHQAFGMADIGFGLSSSGGYISLEELKEYGVELDLHWTPKTKREVKARHA